MSLDEQTAKMLFSSEQMETAFAQIATLFGTYYETLMTHSVPADAAVVMTRDLAWLQLVRQIYPQADVPPVPEW